MPRAITLAPVETKVLHAIALYRFINVELLSRVVDATRQTIRDAARRLRVLGLVGSTAPKAWKFNPAEPDAKREFGKPAYFWVSMKGATYLSEKRQHDPAVPFVIGSTRRPGEGDGREDEHRLGIVAIHIAFRAWAEATGKCGVSFLCDFEPGSIGMGKVTAIPYLWETEERFYMPDGLLRFSLDADNSRQLMVLEFERGGYRQDLSKFFTSKLKGVRFAAHNDLVENYKDHPRASPFLIVFASDKMREAALKAWPEPQHKVWQRFFVKSLAEIEDGDFSRGWWRPDGQRPTLYASPVAGSSDDAAQPGL